jgi:hypothetical protein
MTSSVVGEAELALPKVNTVLAVTGAEDGEVTTNVVEEVSGDEIALTPVPRDRENHPVQPEPGTRLELVWKDLDGLLALPVEVVASEPAPEPRLRVRPTGPATPGQRRSAVRAPLGLPVQLTRGQEQLSGLTVDISEGGLRCVVDPAAEAPNAQADGAVKPRLAAGERIAVVLTFETAVIEANAEVVRLHRREDERTELSLRFADLPELTEDLVRRRVFARLRELRQRGMI